MTNTLFAYDLEPRRWNPLPAGTNIVSVAYGHTSGDVNFNPLLEIEDANVKIDTLVLNYTRFFTLGDKLTRLDATLPLHRAKWGGLLRGEPGTAEREGMGDPRFRFSVNLLGASTASSKVSKPNNTVVGAAISVTVPWGQYYENKLLNLGSNRYTIRPQIGVVHTRGPWSYELTGSIFYFTDNNNFYNNSKREQDPFYAAQAHIIRIFKPGVWGSLSAGYGEGGASKVNSGSLNDKNKGLISALSFGIPIAPDQGLKFSYTFQKLDIPKDKLSDTGTFIFVWSLRF